MATFKKKKTKIVCTMGPAVEDEEVLRQLILHGMNVARFNFSHGSHEYHRKNIERVRKLSRELAIPVAILLDTKGPEVRTGLLKDGEKVQLEDRQDLHRDHRRRRGGAPPSASRSTTRSCRARWRRAPSS